MVSAQIALKMAGNQLGLFTERNEITHLREAAFEVMQRDHVDGILIEPTAESLPSNFATLLTPRAKCSRGFLLIDNIHVDVRNARTDQAKLARRGQCQVEDAPANERAAIIDSDHHRPVAARHSQPGAER
jgi:hypothetical protein